MVLTATTAFGRGVALTRRSLGAGTARVASVAGGGTALAACGVQTGPSDYSGGTAAVAPATIQYWDWAPVWKDLVDKLATTFALHQPKVTVQWDIPADYWTKLQVAIAGDNAPDTWRMSGDNLPSWVTLGLLTDITPFVTKDQAAAAALKAMAPVIADYTRRAGKQWTMPFGQALSGIIAYNVDVMKVEGLTPPADLWTSGKWTWAALEEYAVKLTRRDGSRHGHFVERGFETGVLPLLHGDGGSLFDQDGKRAVISSAAGRETFEFLLNLDYRQRVTPTPDDVKQESVQSRFLNGRLAMLPQGSWQIKDLNSLAKAITFDLVPVPLAPATKKNGSTTQMASIAMGKASKQKDQVWAWQTFIGSKEGQDVIARAEYFPARTDSAEQIYYQPALGPAHRSLFRDVLKVAQPYAFLDVAGNTGNWGPIANPIVQQILNGQVAVKDGLQQMQDQLNAAIDRGFK